MKRILCPKGGAMVAKMRKTVVLLALVVAAVFVWKLTAEEPTPGEQRRALRTAFDAGNYKDAYEGLRKLTLDPKCDPMQGGRDVEIAVAALQKLGRSEEIDEYREGVVQVHAENWRLLETVANNYLNTENHGYITAG